MGSIFSPSPSAPTPAPAPPLPPAPDDPDVVARKEEVRLSLLRRRGRASTILTSGLGDPSTPSVRRATLGGE
jgi:hypothetical protein